MLAVGARGSYNGPKHQRAHDLIDYRLIITEFPQCTVMGEKKEDVDARRSSNPNLELQERFLQEVLSKPLHK